MGQDLMDIYRSRIVASTESCKNCYLAIVELAKLAAPLSGNSNRHLAFLGKSCFVNIQRTVIMPPKQLVTISGDLLI